MTKDEKSHFLFNMVGSILQEMEAEIPHMPDDWDSVELVWLFNYKVWLRVRDIPRDDRTKRAVRFNILKDRLLMRSPVEVWGPASQLNNSGDQHASD